MPIIAPKIRQKGSVKASAKRLKKGTLKTRVLTEQPNKSKYDPSATQKLMIKFPKILFILFPQFLSIIIVENSIIQRQVPFIPIKNLSKMLRKF